MANSVDTDLTAPFGAVRSGSALFAQDCLSLHLSIFSSPGQSAGRAIVLTLASALVAGSALAKC